MNFKQIEAFRAVMLTGSMTAAAQKLHTSQPNVSRVIGKLETEIAAKTEQLMADMDTAGTTLSAGNAACTRPRKASVATAIN